MIVSASRIRESAPKIWGSALKVSFLPRKTVYRNKLGTTPCTGWPIAWTRPFDRILRIWSHTGFEKIVNGLAPQIASGASRRGLMYAHPRPAPG